MKVCQTELQRWLPDIHLHMPMTHSVQIASTVLGHGLQLKPAAVWNRGDVTAATAYCGENQSHAPSSLAM